MSIGELCLGFVQSAACRTPHARTLRKRASRQPRPCMTVAGCALLVVLAPSRRPPRPLRRTGWQNRCATSPSFERCAQCLALGVDHIRSAARQASAAKVLVLLAGPSSSMGYGGSSRGVLFHGLGAVEVVSLRRIFASRMAVATIDGGSPCGEIGMDHDERTLLSHHASVCFRIGSTRFASAVPPLLGYADTCFSRAWRARLIRTCMACSQCLGQHMVQSSCDLSS